VESRFRPNEADRYVERYGAAFGEDLARRVHTAHLLAEDQSAVLLEGGSVSVKSLTTDLFGDPVEVLQISGGGVELHQIEPSDFASCRLASVRQILDRASTIELGVIAELSSSRLRVDDPAPPPSTLIHAVLPGRFVDHALADVVLTIVSQPDPAGVIEKIFGDRALFVPYAPAGAALARRTVELLRNRMVAGMPRPSVVIAERHGIFTWGETADESYAAMVGAVSLIEDYITEIRGASSRPTISVPDMDLYVKLAPLFRGVLARVTARPWLLTWRTSTLMRAFCDRLEMTLLAQLGCAAPEHAVSTKWKPLVIGTLDFTNANETRARLEDALHDYAATYEDYVRRSSAGRRRSPKLLDPWPRVILFEGLGALTLGRSAAEAHRAADLYEHEAGILEAAHAMHGFRPAGELEVFDAEHGPWARPSSGSIGQEIRPLDGRIALITGAATDVGLATARALLKAGAHVVLADRNEASLTELERPLAAAHRERVTHISCDVVIEAQVRRAVAHACTHFGGLDIVVSNAGSAFSGLLHSSSGHTALRASLELNLLGHQNVARAASEVFLLQGAGGVLLFNASSGVLSQGPDAGPYAVPEAALLALMRQYAIDLGSQGIRANAVSAGRVRSDLWSDNPPESRSKSRTIPAEEYFKANLLRRETTADDVGGAFVFLAGAAATTGCVITVDGGVASAFPR
jgi:rhamnose utilization protein RhaD (predicted bifunctional aldolase and dehydrogenase)/NAD(P)-dependent dehydrogenase (short-subunit alcohol dehydrogenase family)